jgi:dihydroorotase
LETAFALSYTYLVKPGYINLAQLIRLMSVNPACLLGLPNQGLAVGQPADFTVVDIKDPYTVDRGTFLSKSRNTPFHGMKVWGRVMLTVCGGKVSYGLSG